MRTNILNYIYFNKQKQNFIIMTTSQIHQIFGTPLALAQYSQFKTAMKWTAIGVVFGIVGYQLVRPTLVKMGFIAD